MTKTRTIEVHDEYDLIRYLTSLNADDSIDVRDIWDDIREIAERYLIPLAHELASSTLFEIEDEEICYEGSYIYIRTRNNKDPVAYINLMSGAVRLFDTRRNEEVRDLVMWMKRTVFMCWSNDFFLDPSGEITDADISEAEWMAQSWRRVFY